ncbi:MAG: hypothetical protein K9H64_15835 [Bacteroidales bacterium]|nr:hypothetical protein [Bacteroidales bacterium]MCF8457439.1 hypothetical protein [Bacteroidales bacterium]
MTNKETVNRNIGLTFDFLKDIIDKPELLDEVKDNSTIEFLQKDYPEREPTNQKIADKFIKVKRSFEMI